MYTRHRESYDQNLIEDVAKFHEKFKVPQRKQGDPLDAALLRFRLRFLAEELYESNQAAARSDLPELLDGLVDLVVVAIGTAYVLNLDFAGAWERVRAANLAKVLATSAADSKRGYAGDIVKPEGWKAPNHNNLFHPDDLRLAPLTTEKGLVNLSAYFNQ